MSSVSKTNMEVCAGGLWFGRGTSHAPCRLEITLGSSLQEYFWIDFCLLQNRWKRSFGHIARVIGYGSVPIRMGVEPNLVTSGSLTIEFEAAFLELPYDLPVAESRQAAHLRWNYNCVVAAISNGRQIRKAIALAARLDQFARDISGDVERFGDSTPLSNEARQFIGCCKE